MGGQNVSRHGEETGTAQGSDLGRLSRGHKPKIVGSVQAVDADEAVKKAAEEFKVDAWRPIAVQRR